MIAGYLSRDELYAALKQYGGDVHMDIEQVLAEVDKVCLVNSWCHWDVVLCGL